MWFYWTDMINVKNASENIFIEVCLLFKDKTINIQDLFYLELPLISP